MSPSHTLHRSHAVHSVCIYRHLTALAILACLACSNTNLNWTKKKENITIDLLWPFAHTTQTNGLFCFTLNDTLDFYIIECYSIQSQNPITVRKKKQWKKQRKRWRRKPTHKKRPTIARIPKNFISVFCCRRQQQKQQQTSRTIEHWSLTVKLQRMFVLSFHLLCA